ncbi:MAG: tetratricopeptide repeat protein [Flavobacteriales bacterium]|nr:tetratricopeptide repeat protein [Bacteroidota bacterium]MCB9239971.1 tetratricopeptide repeat protein [Flavobacteriales bacterium]
MSQEENVVAEGSKGKFSLDRFINENQRVLMIGGLVLIVLAAGIWFYKAKYQPQRELAANDAIFMAERYFGQDSLDVALNGDGNYPGFYDVIDDFGSTKSGKRASYYVGVILMKKGQYEEAIDYLKKADFDDEMVGPLSRCLIGDCYSEMEQYEEAADFYLKCANKRDNDFTTPYGHQKAARVYEQLGDWDKSLKSLEVIQNDYKETRFAENIEMLVSRAKTAAENQ